MANKTSAEKGRGKGVAFAKWAKIDKAQRNMFMFVCGASIILGATVVGIVYFSKVISFNATLISEKDSVIKTYKNIQGNLNNIADKVAALTNNEKLEIVGRERENIAKCTELVDKSLSEERTIEDFELARTCTALRVIPDAMPSKKNSEATLASFNQLLLWSNPSLKIEGISESEDDGSYGTGGDEYSDGGVSDALSSLNVAISLNDSVNNVKDAFAMVEKSIRNFDILSATLSYSGEMREAETIEMSAIYKAYYSGSVNIEKKSKKICADKTSKKCTGSNVSGGSGADASVDTKAEGGGK